MARTGKRRSEGQAAARPDRAHDARDLRAASCGSLWWIGLRGRRARRAGAGGRAPPTTSARLPTSTSCSTRARAARSRCSTPRARSSPGAASSSALTRAEAVSPHLINAIIATEDRRFYWHFGVDLQRHRPGGAGQPARRRDGAGRLVDHPAGGEARLLRQHPHARAQDQGGPGGAGAGVEVLQERDPVDLPQPRLSRRRRHRLRGGRRSATSASPAAEVDPGRGGDAGGAPARALALRADQRPRPRPGRAPRSSSG